MTTPVATHRSIAVLNLPRPIAIVISIARAIIIALTGNAAFPTPVPTLAAVSAAITDLENAQAVALTRVKGAAQTRNQKLAALVTLLRQLRDYVQTVADASPDSAAALIHSAAMNVRKVSLAGKRVFSVKQGALSGAVSILAPAAGPRASYEWEMSADGGKTWQPLPPTMPSRTTASGLQPATTYAFRYRSVTKAGASDWSQPITIVVK
jgi:hypothetical protein